MKEPKLVVNPEKEEFVQVQDKRFACYAIPTDLVTEKDNLDEVVLWYAKPLLLFGSGETNLQVSGVRSHT